MRSTDVHLRPEEQVALAPFTTLGVGGAARWFVRAGSVEQIAAAHRWTVDRGVPMFVLGGGSNLVLADAGVDGLVVQVAIAGRDFTASGGDVRAAVGAGEWWDPVVAEAVGRGLAGIECLSGIPGTTGGTPIQNVGAYGQEVGETIEAVEVYDRHEGTVRTLGAGECGFSYRMSRFKRDDVDRFVVCRVLFRLRPGAPTVVYPDLISYLGRAGITAPTVAQVREAVLAVRRRKGMVLDPADADTHSVGSFFMNPIVAAPDRERIATIAGIEPPGFVMPGDRVKIPAAWLIERAGFARGFTDGAVGISSKHTLALVNRGGATARDVLRLAGRIKRGVLDRFGVWLRPEPVFVGFEADPGVEFLKDDGRDDREGHEG